MWGGVVVSREADDRARGLVEDFHERAMLSREAGAHRLLSALERWAEFLGSLDPAFVPFIRAEHAGDLVAAAYAERTMGMFMEAMRVGGSRRRGQQGMAVKADTLAGYVSAIRTHRGLEAGYRLLRGDMVLLAAQAKRMRLEDGPGSERRLRRGFRARHFRAARLAGFDIDTWWGVVRWAFLRLGHNALMRGAERGRASGKAFSAARGLTLAHVTWVSAAEYDGVYRLLVVWLVPAKDASGRAKRIPVPIRRRWPDGVDGVDPAECTYEVVRRAWNMTATLVPRDQWANTPLFRRMSGEAISTGDVLMAIRLAAVAAGDEPGDFGAHSARIGGATDYADRFGVVKAPILIRKRGRWDSDMGEIYARVSGLEVIDASVEIWESEGLELEAVIRGFGRCGPSRPSCLMLICVVEHSSACVDVHLCLCILYM